jgi:hypothetical protein
MKHSYLKPAHITYLPDRERRLPRDRYRQYLLDLYKLYDDTLSEETFMEGNQYTFVELGDAVIHQFKQHHSLNSVDLMVISHWAYEFDPDHAACAPYFMHQHQFDCHAFDICDQGVLSPFTALNVMRAFQSNGNSSNALLMLMEQTTIPRNKNNHDLIPSKDGAALIEMISSDEDIPHSLKIIDTGIIPECDIFEKGINIDNLLSTITKNRTSLDKTHFLFTKNNLIYKAIQYYQSCVGSCSYFDYRAGVLPFAEALNQVFSFYHREHSIIFYDDVDSADIGWLYLERISP